MSRLIDAMIVGVEKAGTTSLLRYLSEHSQVSSHEVMEMPFFVDNEIYQKGWDWAYKEYFPFEVNTRVLLAKSVGCMYWEHVPERLYAHNPDMKLIAMLRSPVDRAYSAYWYAVQMGREDKRTFEEAIAAEKERLKTGEDFHFRYHAYLRRGFYSKQLERLFRVFHPDQVKIVILEDFKRNPQKTVNELFEFLTLDSVSVNVGQRHNETTGGRNPILFLLGMQGGLFRKVLSRCLPRSLKEKTKSLVVSLGNKKKKILPINEETKSRLLRFYEADVALLERIIGKDLTIWRK